MRSPIFRAKQPPSCAIEEVLYVLLWRYRHGQLRPSEVADRDWSIERGIAAYGELAAKLQTLGCEVLFEVLPSRAAALASQPPRAEAAHLESLQAQLEARQVAVGFPHVEISQQPDPGALYHDVGHLSAAGHAFYASYLAERLLDVSKKCSTAEPSSDGR